LFKKPTGVLPIKPSAPPTPAMHLWVPSLALAASPPAFPSSFSVAIAADATRNSTAARLDVNAEAFALQKTGGLGYFTANFCNASGMFAYVSAATGCYYQRGGPAGVCDINGWRNAEAFLGLVHDNTFELLVHGIGPDAVRVPGPSGEVVWMDRTPTCPNLDANQDVNVTLAADNVTLLGWSRGSTVYGPPGTTPRSCNVSNDVYDVTQFAPTSDIDSDKVGAFVAERIAAERLACSPFQRR
jgi:hypothetical protein